MKSKTLKEVEADLYYEVAKGDQEPKGQHPYTILDYIRLAYLGELENVSMEYREFALQAKHLWPKLEAIPDSEQRRTSLREHIQELLRYQT
jgi:hypothetical protein